jgi:hypothetical protein
MANGSRPSGRAFHTPATYLMAMCCAEMHPYQTHSSPLEAAEAGTHTVGHSPQGCRPFRASPPMPLSVLLVRTIGEVRPHVNKNLSQKSREIGHLDKRSRRNKVFLKKVFQNPFSNDQAGSGFHTCVAQPPPAVCFRERWAIGTFLLVFPDADQHEDALPAKCEAPSGATRC